jgi:hypothetical protein
MRSVFVGFIAAIGFSGLALAQEASAPPTPAITPEVPAPAPVPETAPAPVVTLPTSGVGAQVIAVLDNVCRPAINGGNLDAVAKAAGYKKKKDGWLGILGAKPYTVSLSFAGSNPKVCDFWIDYPVGTDQGLIEGLSAWTFLHNPSLQPQRNDEYKTDLIRRTFSWDASTADGGLVAMVFIRERKLDGTSTSKTGERAHILYQIP